MLEKYDCFAWKYVYKIGTADELRIYAYEPETKQQFTVWVFEPEPWKKHFEADGRLLFRQNWSCGDCSTWAS